MSKFVRRWNARSPWRVHKSTRSSTWRYTSKQEIFFGEFLTSLIFYLASISWIWEKREWELNHLSPFLPLPLFLPLFFVFRFKYFRQLFWIIRAAWFCRSSWTISSFSCRSSSSFWRMRILKLNQKRFRQAPVEIMKSNLTQLTEASQQFLSKHQNSFARPSSPSESHRARHRDHRHRYRISNTESEALVPLSI